MEVAVVMCTYNGEQFVAAQLDSILQQTHPAKEILVFDDQSTDNTFNILQSYRQQYPHIRVFQNHVNIGFTRNFEQALQAASSDIIAIADQDDVWAINKIEKMLGVWEASYPLIHCKSVSFTNEPPIDAAMPPDSISFEGTDGRKLGYFNTISGHALMIRRSFLTQVLPFPDGLMYDWWMGAVAAYHGGVQFVPEVLVYQRVHDANITVTKEKVARKHKIAAHKKQAHQHNIAFSRLAGIPPAHADFFRRFATLLAENNKGKFNGALFRFLLQYRSTVFYYKRSFHLFSYLKHSYRIARY